MKEHSLDKSEGPLKAQCQQCGASGLDGEVMPVCERCRLAIARHDFPTWLKNSAFIVLLMAIIAGVQSPSKLAIAIAYKSAQNHAIREEWEKAFQAYQALSVKFPGNVGTTLSYVEAALHSNHLGEASDGLQLLSHDLISESEGARLLGFQEDLKRALAIQTEKESQR